MRSPVSRVAAAAIFVLAIAGVALWFHGGGTTPAFADFLKPILEAKTVKYKMTTEMDGPPAAEESTTVSHDAGPVSVACWRLEMRDAEQSQIEDGA